LPAVTSPGPTAITHEPMRLAFELAWQSVCAGSLGIGAVVTRADLSIVTTGRNRLFETDLVTITSPARRWPTPS